MKKIKGVGPAFAVALAASALFVGHVSASFAQQGQQDREGTRKPPCGCYVCGTLLFVTFEDKNCAGILAEDACAERLANLPKEERERFLKSENFCEKVQAKVKFSNFKTYCPVYAPVCAPGQMPNPMSSPNSDCKSYCYDNCSKKMEGISYFEDPTGAKHNRCVTDCWSACPKPKPSQAPKPTVGPIPDCPKRHEWTWACYDKCMAKFGNPISRNYQFLDELHCEQDCRKASIGKPCK